MRGTWWTIVGTGAAVCMFAALLMSAGAAFQQPQEESVLCIEPTAETSEEAQTLSFPVQVDGTSLVAEHMVYYEGPFTEDGSDEPVVGISALVLRNAGQQEIAEAEVILEKGQTRLTFRGYDIVPGQSVMVLEADGKGYVKEGFTACTGWVREAEGLPVPLETLLIESVDMGTLAVTNQTDHTLRDICLYHKTYLPDGTYVGGISYHTRIEVLAPGQTVQVSPEHYADGYSKVFKVTAEQEDSDFPGSCPKKN